LISKKTLLKIRKHYFEFLKAKLQLIFHPSRLAYSVQHKF